jgi:hypothetical protein
MSLALALYLFLFPLRSASFGVLANADDDSQLARTE